MNRTTWVPARSDIDDRHPTRPVTLSRRQVDLVLRGHREPAHRAPGTARSTVLIALAVVVVAVVGALGHLHDPREGTAPETRPTTVADGVVPDGVTVFDDEYPAVAELDPALLEAVRRAAKDARRSGITFYVNSGWRSPEYQDRLLREAVARYGSRTEAARWVATPETSAHVSGDSIDIGHSDATTWLAKNGARYGLCQIYRNEPWHFELRPGEGCPRMYADPTQDPRMAR